MDKTRKSTVFIIEARLWPIFEITASNRGVIVKKIIKDITADQTHFMPMVITVFCIKVADILIFQRDLK